MKLYAFKDLTKASATTIETDGSRLYINPIVFFETDKMYEGNYKRIPEYDINYEKEEE